MAEPITTDNFDDLLKRTYDRKFEELLDRMRDIERLVKKDVSLDKQQKREQPESEDMLRDIYSKIDFLQKRVDNFENPLKEIKTMLEEIRSVVKDLKDY